MIPHPHLAPVDISMQKVGNISTLTTIVGFQK